MEYCSNTAGLPYDLPSSCNISLIDVELSLVNLLLTKSVGPDGLSGFFTYNLRSVLCFSLFLIYSKSLSDGVFPDIWKISSDNPIFKSGDGLHQLQANQYYHSPCQTT